MSTVLLDSASPTELRQLVKELQESLQVSLVRIHNLRSREKQLLQENAELRAVVQALKKGEAPSVGAEEGGAHADASTSQPLSPSASMPAFTSTDRQPLYVSYLNKQVPVFMYLHGRKVPGSLVLTEKLLEFVEIKARIESDNFLGITLAKDAYISPQLGVQTYMGPDTPASPNRTARRKKLGCCVTPPLVQHEDEPPAPYSDESGASSPRQAYPRNRSWHGDDNGTPQPPPPPTLENNSTGTWKIVWKMNDVPQQLTFEASQQTRELLHKHTERWLIKSDRTSEDDISLGLAVDERDIEVCSPVHLVTVPSSKLRMAEPSQLMSHEEAAALQAVLPPRYRLGTWSLAYSTKQHGISLQTLYRKAAGGTPCLLLVKDQAGYVFGSFTSESWRVASRFFGTGETFVFQLQPHCVMYTWNEKCKSKNDYFMYAQPECLGVGGCGRFAIWVDSELLHGTSGTCGTFGSPCLAHAEEFKVMGMEVWHVG